MDDLAPRRGYRWYVLGLLTAVYAFNFIDRQIVTILAPYLKADLGLTDAQVGLLYGTAFALFYALFGLPLAKLADGWNRARTLSIGLGFWSVLTMASGGAGNFAQLALARMGVGIGEASATPSAFSLLQDYFPKARRATALAIYSSGIYLGIGASLMIGGSVVAAWDAAFAGGGAPLDLVGWRAAYLAVGAPGLLLALIVWLTVREPVRGAIDGQPQPGTPHPFRSMFREMANLFPLFAPGALRGRHMGNLVLLAGCIGGAVVMVLLTDGLLTPARRGVVLVIAGMGITTNMVQWGAIAIGVYATASWVRSTAQRDPVVARLLAGTPAFIALAVGAGVLSLGSYGLSAFLFLYGKTYLGLTAQDGLILGAISAVAGGSGTALGGIIADAWRRHHPAGRVYVAIVAAIISGLFACWEYNTADITRFYVACFGNIIFLTMWLGPVMASGQDLVLPRMRGTATAVQFLGINLIGLGLGPYAVGLISDATGDLRFAMLSVLVTIPAAVVLFLFAARHLPDAETTLTARARAAGETIA